MSSMNCSAGKPPSPDQSLQVVSLDFAVAPSLARPVAPFAKSERKRAYTSAIYYSECCLRRIPPREADLAAYDMQRRYTKWWVDSTYKGEPETKRIKLSNEERSNIITSSDNCEEPRAESLHIVSEEESPSKRQRLPGMFSCSTRNNDDQFTTAEEYRDIVRSLKLKLVANLQATGGDMKNCNVNSYVDDLHALYRSRCGSNREASVSLDGTWLPLSKQTFSECSGRNNKGEQKYTLGRMSFDMFRPSNLECSIQRTYNEVQLIDATKNSPIRSNCIPRELKKYIKNGRKVFQYDVVVDFTIEANQTCTKLLKDKQSKTGAVSHDDDFVLKHPIKATMTNHGYMVPHQNDSDRLSIWFTKGSVKFTDKDCSNHHEVEELKEIFGSKEDTEKNLQIKNSTKAHPNEKRSEADRLAANILLGVHVKDKLNDDGSMCYYLKKPIGGLGRVFCDVLYCDESLRIMKGHMGSIFLDTKVPTVSDTKASTVSD